MDAADVCVDYRWDGAGSALACVADISVDGGMPVPMVGLLAGNGELVIPTDWEDPPVADGAGHAIRIELRPPWIPLARGRVQSMLEDCYVWRLGYGAAVVEPWVWSLDGEPAHVLVASTLPCSVRAKTSAAEHVSRDRLPWRDATVWASVGVLLAGFVVGFLIIRVRRFPCVAASPGKG